LWIACFTLGSHPAAPHAPQHAPATRRGQLQTGMRCIRMVDTPKALNKDRATLAQIGEPTH